MNRVWLPTVQGPCSDGCLSKKLEAAAEAAHAIHAASARNIVERRAVTRYHASRDRTLSKTIRPCGVTIHVLATAARAAGPAEEASCDSA